VEYEGKHSISKHIRQRYHLVLYIEKFSWVKAMFNHYYD